MPSPTFEIRRLDDEDMMEEVDVSINQQVLVITEISK